MEPILNQRPSARHPDKTVRVVTRRNKNVRIDRISLSDPDFHLIVENFREGCKALAYRKGLEVKVKHVRVGTGDGLAAFFRKPGDIRGKRAFELHFVR